jgi:hypothetical protein
MKTYQHCLLTLVLGASLQACAAPHFQLATMPSHPVTVMVRRDQVSIIRE